MNSCVFAVVVTVACFAVRQNATTLTAPQQELEFAWPIGTTARVEVEGRRQRDTGKSAAPSPLVRGRYRMQILPHDEGRLIRYDQYEALDPVVGVPAAMVGEVVSSWMPSIIVGADGAFRRVEDIASLKRAIDELLAASTAKFTATTPALRDLSAMVTSEAYLTQAAAQEWQMLVGSWVGLSVAPGRFEVTAEQPSPLWPDTTVRMKTKVEVAAAQPCTRAGTAHRCVAIELTSVPDPIAMQALTRRLLDGIGDMHSAKYDRFDVTTVTRLTLESATMLPHHFALVKTINLSGTMSDGKRLDSTRIDQKSLKFTYGTQDANRD